MSLSSLIEAYQENRRNEELEIGQASAEHFKSLTDWICLLQTAVTGSGSQNWIAEQYRAALAATDDPGALLDAGISLPRLSPLYRDTVNRFKNVVQARQDLPELTLLFKRMECTAEFETVVSKRIATLAIATNDPAVIIARRLSTVALSEAQCAMDIKLTTFIDSLTLDAAVKAEWFHELLRNPPAPLYNALDNKSKELKAQMEA